MENNAQTQDTHKRKNNRAREHDHIRFPDDPATLLQFDSERIEHGINVVVAAKGEEYPLSRYFAG